MKLIKAIEMLGYRAEDVALVYKNDCFYCYKDRTLLIGVWDLDLEVWV